MAFNQWVYAICEFLTVMCPGGSASNVEPDIMLFVIPPCTRGILGVCSFMYTPLASGGFQFFPLKRAIAFA